MVAQPRGGSLTPMGSCPCPRLSLVCLSRVAQWALAPSSLGSQAVGTRHTGGPLGPGSQEPSQPLLPQLTWPLPPSQDLGVVASPALPSGSLTGLGGGRHRDSVQGPPGFPLVSAQTHGHPKAGVCTTHPGSGHGSDATCRHPQLAGQHKIKDPVWGPGQPRALRLSRLLGPLEAPLL